MKLPIPSWDEFFMRHVYLVGSKSKDESTQIGAVLVKDGGIISEGYNGFPRKIWELPERNLRPAKYAWTEHGERNAIYNAARKGISTIESVMFTNYPPCTDCCRGVIQAGISEIVFHKQWAEIWDDSKNDKWKGQDSISLQMFNEAGVKVRWIDLKLGVQCLMSEKIYEV